ncbi:MAG: DUF4129 domain-containing protein [Spirochaetales bacterium]|nr:DUF4129 domain-containing protein [Spirochaetales bacterium]
MDRTTETLSKWSLLPEHSIILLSLWCMLEPRGHVVSIPFSLVLALLSVLLLIDLILLSKEVRLLVFAVTNVAFAAVSVFLVQRLLVLSSYSAVTHIIFSAMVVMLFTDAAIISLRDVSRTELISTFDISIVFEGFLIAISGSDFLENPSQFIIWGFVSCLMLLLTLTVLRVRRSRAAGYAVLLSVIVVLGVLAFFSMKDFEAVSSSLIRILAKIVNAIGAFLRGIIEAIYEWIISLFGESYVNDFDVNAYSQRIDTDVVREYKDVSWLVPVILAAVIVVVLVLIIRYRNKRLGRRRKKSRSSKEKRTRIRSGRISRFYRRLFAPLLFWLRYLKNRNTPAGRFIRFERKMRRKGIRRPKYETPHSFLRRLAPSYPEENLNVLADELECIFFNS